MRKLLLLITLSLSFKAYSQTYFEVGEYVTPDQFSSLLIKETPQINGIVLDTISPSFFYLPFLKILDTSQINGYVKVELVTKKGNGIIGWVEIEKIIQHPIPDYPTLRFFNTPDKIDLLNAIVKNCDWYRVNRNSEYIDFKCEHAASYFLLGQIYFELDSFKRAIYYLTKSNDILPKHSTFIIRASAKTSAGDYSGSIIDCNKAINWKSPTGLSASDNEYYTDFSLQYDVFDEHKIRAYNYFKLGKFDNALADYNISIKGDKENGELYFFRALVKFNLNQKSAACLDLSSAGEYGYVKAYDYIRDYCK